jgi:large subunit ribosomal protein L10
MTEKTHHVAEKKKTIAKNIQKLMLDYPIIAAVNMENLPTPQLQQMKSQLRGKIEITMTKRRVMKHAIEEIKDKKKNIEKLEEHLKGMPALIFTKENPFSLFKTLKKSKTSAPAKAGQTAPFDLKIPQGPTGFAPGPVIGELAQLGIKSGVEGGKVVIKEDSVVVKEGEKIPAKAAEILTRLGVEPMEVGLNVTAVYENGEIFTANILDIDEEKFMKDLQNAALCSFNLAINSAYITKDTINLLINKAFNDAKALGAGQNIIDEGIIDDLLGKAEGSALSLKSSAKIEAAEKPKVEEKKVEEKKPEVKAEVKEAPKVEEKPKVEEQRIKDSPTSKSKDFEEKPKEEPTPAEKKEEKIVEEEKKIVEEEKKLEKPEKPKIEAPVEKEVKEEVKEEEEKQLEKERIEKEKELEKVQEERKIEEAKREEEKKKVEEERKKQEEARKKEEEQKKVEEGAKRKKEEEQKRKAEEAKIREEKKKVEEEKRILEEEKKLEKEAEKPKIEAPVEKEVKEEVKEEEEKQLEKERIEKEEPQDTDSKIAEMVAKTKKFVKGEIPDAEKLVEEAGKLAAKEVEKEVKIEEKPKEEIKIEEKKPEEKKEAPKIVEVNRIKDSKYPSGVKEVPKVQEKIVPVKEEKKEDSEKKKKEKKEVEDLAQELVKKGTLRK